jgi:hypothetical protein
MPDPTQSPVLGLKEALEASKSPRSPLNPLYDLQTNDPMKALQQATSIGPSQDPRISTFPIEPPPPPNPTPFADKLRGIAHNLGGSLPPPLADAVRWLSHYDPVK